MWHSKLMTWLWLSCIVAVAARCAFAQGDVAAAAPASAPLAAPQVDVAAVTSKVDGGAVFAAKWNTEVAKKNWTADDLWMRFGDSVDSEYVGCYQDIVEVASSAWCQDWAGIFKRPRRMSQRLGIWPTMTKEECARRAAAAGWSLFALTPHEDATEFGITCWGSNNETRATEEPLQMDEANCISDFQLRLYRVSLRRPDMPLPLAGEEQGSSSCTKDAQVYLLSCPQPASKHHLHM
jgi:hypothetical protein